MLIGKINHLQGTVHPSMKALLKIGKLNSTDKEPVLYYLESGDRKSERVEIGILIDPTIL